MSRNTSLLDDREDSYSYRGYDNEDTHRTSSFGPSGEGIAGAASTFYQKNRKAVLIGLGTTLVVILLIIVIAVAASKKGEGDDPTPTPPLFTKTSLGGMSAYQAGTSGPTLFYLPDASGWNTAAQALATDFVNAGFQVWALDYFNGGTSSTCGSNCSFAESIASVSLAVADARQRWPGEPFLATGYDFGGGVGVALTSGTTPFDVVVVSYAANVSPSMFQSASSPLFAVMPQNDPNFNNLAGGFMGTITCKGCRGHEVEMKVYPGVGHGFAEVAIASDPNAVAQKAAAFADTVAFLKMHSTQVSTPSPQLHMVKQTPQGTNFTTSAGMNVYQTGSGSVIVLYLMDASGWRLAATELADSYASKGFRVYMPDYFNGGNYAGWDVDNSTARVRAFVFELRQLYPTALIFTTGYCWGGGVGIRLASGPNRVDASVVAHASWVTPAVWSATTAPVFAVMPQDDSTFNDQFPTYLNSFTCWPLSSTCQSREGTFKVYPGVVHGFAVAVNMSDPNAVAQKLAAFHDTVNFFNLHSSLTPTPPTFPIVSSTGDVPPVMSSTGDVPPVMSSTGTALPMDSSMGSSSPMASSTGTVIPTTKTTLGDMTAYQIGTSGPILLYLPDIGGVGTATMALATEYATAGFQVWVLDYFDGGNGRAGGWTIDNSTLRTRLAIADIRQQFPAEVVYATGYCWGGGVGMQVTYGPSRVDLLAVAHAAGVNITMFNQSITPILAVMPQNDANFNNQSGALMLSTTCNGCRGHVLELKVYPGVGHGFAVAVNLSDPNAVKQKAAAFADTVAFFQNQMSPSPLPTSLIPPISPSSPQQQGTNITIGGMNTYQVGSSDRILLFFMDIFGWRPAVTDLANEYAAQGFSVYMPDYCNGGGCQSVSVDVSAARVRVVISTLRQQFPGTLIFSTGYCYGGGVGIRMAMGSPMVDVSVVAHAQAPSIPLFTNVTAPLLAIMPQNDNTFNNNVPAYLGTLICSNCPQREVAFKVYPGVGHGFAVAVNMADPNAMQQKQQAFLDTLSFLKLHSS